MKDESGNDVREVLLQATPERCDDPGSFIGQKAISDKVDKLIEKCKSAQIPFPHTLLVGEEGVGKKTLACSIASRLGAKVIATYAFAMPNAGDLIGILTNLGQGDVLFVESVHQLRRNSAEFLAPALKDFQIDFVIDRGPYAKTIKFNLKRFTLIATVPDENALDKQLRDLFLCTYKLGGYSKAELLEIFSKRLKSSNVKHECAALEFIVNKYGDDTSAAQRAFRKVLKYTELTPNSSFTVSLAEECLAVTAHEVEIAVLNETQDRYLPEDVRHEVWRRDEGKCAKCGSRESLEFDHIIPLSKGGSNTARNIELLCETCNRRKSDDL